MNPLRASSVMLVLFTGAASCCFGQGDSSLSDPTRPPTVAIESAPASSEGVPPPSGLQTIILGKGHKPMAVINGVTVEVGDKVGEARLVKLSETQAVLQGPNGREILYLMPGVEKMGTPLMHKPGLDQKRPAGQTRPQPESTP